MNNKKKSQLKTKRTNIKTVKLSAGKAKKLEKGFRLKVEETRTVYLSDELNKYKNIEVVYD